MIKLVFSFACASMWEARGQTKENYFFYGYWSEPGLSTCIQVAGAHPPHHKLHPVFLSGLLLSGFLLSGILLSGILLSGILLSGFLLSRFLLSWILLSWILLSGILLSGILLSGFLLSGILLSGFLLGLLMREKQYKRRATVRTSCKRWRWGGALFLCSKPTYRYSQLNQEEDYSMDEVQDDGVFDPRPQGLRKYRDYDSEDVSRPADSKIPELISVLNTGSLEFCHQKVLLPWAIGTWSLYYRLQTIFLTLLISSGWVNRNRDVFWWGYNSAQTRLTNCSWKTSWLKAKMKQYHSFLFLGCCHVRDLSALSAWEMDDCTYDIHYDLCWTSFG